MATLQTFEQLIMFLELGRKSAFSEEEKEAAREVMAGLWTECTLDRERKAIVKDAAGITEEEEEPEPEEEE